MELIVIRHARPERVEGVAGGADPGLTAIGHRQAEVMAEWLGTESIDALYVSPMLRARQTCEPLARVLRLEAIIESNVREFNLTDSDYIPMEELRTDKDAWDAWIAKDHLTPRPEFHRDVRSAVEDIVANHRAEKVVVVCHGGVINSVASLVLGMDGAMFFSPDYSSINRFLFSSRGHKSVVSLNDIGHLRPHPELQLS